MIFIRTHVPIRRVLNIEDRVIGCNTVGTGVCDNVCDLYTYTCIN